jgi:3-deoxy-manno-octulosonate cytidylyltransferase (CMP-KDO synthetase)
LIPARWGSTRFPGKALADLGGKPMVVRVCEQARASGARTVTVATDDARIRAAVERGGFRALMTRPGHASGTDRIAEAAARLRLKADDVVVNVQGDEPLIPPRLIARVAASLRRRRAAHLSTACHPIRDRRALESANVVKVVLDAQGYALYFSRARIPFPREEKGRWYRHAGIYAFRAGFLRKFPKMKQSPDEKTEALEQLRALWHGHRIAVVVSRAEIPPGVDTPQDLAAVRSVMRRMRR